MNVYFMRHGQTNYNLLGLCNDDPADPVHLTELGRAQAAQAAEQLRAARLARIFVSQLPRTRETAEIINIHHAAPIHPHADLNDIRSGFNNKPVADYFAATSHDRLHLRVNGGESLLDYKLRVLRFLDWLHAQAPLTTLVVAHEETMRVFAAQLRGLSDTEMERLHFANCEVVQAVL